MALSNEASSGDSSILRTFNKINCQYPTVINYCVLPKISGIIISYAISYFEIQLQAMRFDWLQGEVAALHSSYSPTNY